MWGIFFLTQLGLFLSSIPIINKTTKKKRILHFLENGGNALLLISQTITGSVTSHAAINVSDIQART